MTESKTVLKTNIRNQLSEYFEKAFKALGADAELGQVIVSTRPDLAPYQCNGALAASKSLKKPPRDIANEIIDQVKGHPFLKSVEIAGPGFLNITPEDKFYSEVLTACLRDPRAGFPFAQNPEHYVIDFGGANIAKPMHVGHLRSAINGACLQSLFRFLGHQVTSDIHLGDWGLQMGQLIDYYKREHPGWIYFNPDPQKTYPEESPVSLEDLQKSYPIASAACKSDPVRLDAAREATRELQSGRAGYRALWRHFWNVSVEALKKDFKRLGIVFDLWKGESDVDPLISDMIEDLKERGFAVYDEGALIIRLEPEEKQVSEELAKKTAQKNQRANPPFMLLKSDGSSLYETTDLATLVDRKRTLVPDYILYVVDLRQQLHFEKLFKAAQKTEYADNTKLEFIGLGTMNGADGRPFKTREGGVLKLSDLMESVVQKALLRLNDAGLAQDMPENEREKIAEKIGLSALKFADLSNNRLTSYVFDLDRFSAFEGKTGPYLLYAGVRIKSLLNKALNTLEGLKGFSLIKNREELINQVLTLSDSLCVNHSQEKALSLILDQFQQALIQASEKRAPHFISDHAYQLAQGFSTFYAACPILAEATPEKVKYARLALSLLTLKQLEICLNLLGIDIPERM